MNTVSLQHRWSGKTADSRLLLGGALLAGLLLLAHSAHAQEGLVVEQLPGRAFIADDGVVPPAARRAANPARLPNARPVSSYALRQVLRLEVYRAAPPSQVRQPQRRRLSPSERAALRRDLLRTYENESFVVNVSPRPRDEEQPGR